MGTLWENLALPGEMRGMWPSEKVRSELGAGEKHCKSSLGRGWGVGENFPGEGKHLHKRCCGERAGSISGMQMFGVFGANAYELR